MKGRTNRSTVGRAEVAAILCGAVVALGWIWRAGQAPGFSSEPDRVSGLLARRAGDIQVAGDLEALQDAVERSLATAGVAVRWHNDVQASRERPLKSNVFVHLEDPTVHQVMEVARLTSGAWLVWRLSPSTDEVIIGQRGWTVPSAGGLVTRVYDVRDLAAGAAAHSRLYPMNDDAPVLRSQPSFRTPHDERWAAEHLSQFIRGTVSPGTWMTMGGSGGFGGSSRIEATDGRLVIRADVPTHRQIEILLAALRAGVQDVQGTVWEAR